VQCIVSDLNVGLTTYNKTKTEMVFTLEAVLITAHGTCKC